MDGYSPMPIEGLASVAAAEAAVAAMREAVGDEVDLMVDCHARPSPAMGLQFGKALEPFGLYFLEDPCWTESVDGMAMINAAITTPVATGERALRDWPIFVTSLPRAPAKSANWTSHT